MAVCQHYPVVRHHQASPQAMSLHDDGNQPLPRSSVSLCGLVLVLTSVLTNVAALQATETAGASNPVTTTVTAEETPPTPASDNAQPEEDETDAEDVDQALAALEQMVVSALPCVLTFVKPN